MLSAGSFRSQVALIAVASVAMAALAVLLIQDVLSSAERTLTREAVQQCATAARELAQQLTERRQDRDRTDDTLPREALDISLQGLTSAVLRSYEGVVGGFMIADEAIGVGGDAGNRPAHLAPEDLLRLRALVRSGAASQSVAVGRGDVLVIAAHSVDGSGYAAWAVKRIEGVRDPSAIRRRWGLAAVALLAAFAVGGVIAVSIRLRRGLETLGASLRQMEEDFDRRIPALPGEFGRIGSAVNQMADRRRTLESELRQRDRLAALGKVVAGVAHEIRNPLNAMRLTLELAQRRIKRGEAGTGEIAGALDEVDRLDGILTRLLSFGRPGAPRREIHDLRQPVERVLRIVQPQAAERNVDLRFEPETPDSFAAFIDPAEIEQALINLLLNAIEAAPPYSIVLVELRRDGDALVVAVQDRGEGIPSSVRDHVFDPYFTTKSSGNGLGLALAREFAVSHGGSLTLQSEHGGGARFLIRLPGIPPEQTHS